MTNEDHKFQSRGQQRENTTSTTTRTEDSILGSSLTITAPPSNRYFGARCV